MVVVMVLMAVLLLTVPAHTGMDASQHATPPRQQTPAAMHGGDSGAGIEE